MEIVNIHVDELNCLVYTPGMNLNLFQDLLAVPSVSGREDCMVAFLKEHIQARGLGRVWSDAHKNVYVVKGDAEFFPTFAAHTDTVQPFDRKVYIFKRGDVFVGCDDKGEQAGIGGDCKSGIMVCLEALERLDNVACVFFAFEEYGCKGAFNSDPDFFKNVGWVAEFDCPGRNLCSYTSSGVRLFQNDGDFIQRALPAFQSRGTLWQHHPYTDVMALRKRFPISCLNLSSGYYNWHSDQEYVRISDTEHAVELAVELAGRLGAESYPFPINGAHKCYARPLIEVGPLVVRDEVLEKELRRQPKPK